MTSAPHKILLNNKGGDAVEGFNCVGLALMP